MNLISRTITGIVAILVGATLTIAGFFNFLALIYGIPILVIGIFILLNKKEDEIEKIHEGGE